MSLKSSKDTYGSVAVSFHWLSAILIVVVLGSGFRSASLSDLEAKAQLLTIHAPVAITVVFLTLARIVWWRFADRKPDPVSDTPGWQHAAARAVHILFYVIILVMGVSGIGMFVLSGAGPIVFGFTEGVLPDFWDYKPRAPHFIGSRVMIGLLVLHGGAALYHHFGRRDGVLRRMWYENA